VGFPTLRRGLFIYRKVGGRGRKGRENLHTRWKKNPRISSLSCLFQHAMAAKNRVSLTFWTMQASSTVLLMVAAVPQGGLSNCDSYLIEFHYLFRFVKVSANFFCFHRSVISWYQRFLYIPKMFDSKKLSSGVEVLGSRNLIILLSSSRRQ
jgi:hypothetical protein